MRLKVIITVNSSNLNVRDQETGKVIAADIEATTTSQLKHAISDTFGAPDWSSVTANLSYRLNPDSRETPIIVSIDGDSELPKIPSNMNGDRVVIVTATNIQMKAGLTEEQEKRYIELISKEYLDGSDILYKDSDLDIEIEIPSIPVSVPILIEKAPDDPFDYQ